VPHQQSSERPKPGDGPFNDPAMAIGAQASTVLIPAMQVVVAVRTGQDDATGGEPLAQRITVVGSVADQVLGIAPVRRDSRVQRRGDERDFRGRRRGNGDSQRNTLTLDQYHAL